jgi:hypothetical protein
MELLSVGSVLMRHRRLVVLGLVFAALAGLLASRHYAEETSSGVAVQRVFIGQPDSPAVKIDSVATQTLTTRVRLLANLMTSNRERVRLSAAARLPLDRFAVIGPASQPPTIPVPLAVQATRASATATTPYVLSLQAADANPIMTLTAGAATAVEAERFVNAATATLEQLVAKAYGEGPGLAVQPLGPVSVSTSVNRPSRVMVLIAPLMVFLFWCSGIVLVTGIARHHRRERVRLQLT